MNPNGPKRGADDDLSTTLLLVQAVQEGDPGALEDLFFRYLPHVRQIVALRTGRRLRQFLELEDIVQEALIRVLQGLENFELRSEGSFRNWLSRCVEREIIKQARTLGRKKRGGGRVHRFSECDTTLLPSSIFGDDHQPTPSEFAQASEVAQKLEDGILAMPEFLRELIILRAVCGMTYAEVAVELGIEREDTLRMAFSRALQKLREDTGFG